MLKRKIGDHIQMVEDMGLSVSFTTGNEAYLFCPFHPERRESMCVNLVRPVWHCFSCERGGSLKQLERMLDSMEEVEQVVIDDELDDESQANINAIANVTLDDFTGMDISDRIVYLQRRGFSRETIRKWGVRRTSLFAVIPVYWDNKLEGLILRSMIRNVKPKYQYQPKGVFHKNDNILVNPNFRVAGGMIVIVEGALDAMKVWQNGYENVCAILGSSISENQVKKIMRIAGSAMLLFDNDAAGYNAMRNVGVALSGMQLYVPRSSLYYSGDPAEMSSEELSEVMENRMSFLKARVSGVV